MTDSNRETELKLRLDDTNRLTEKLKQIGAFEKGKVVQTDILFDYSDSGKTFATENRVLRLRTEISGDKKKSILGYKGSPEIDTYGIKTRDEFETQVSNPETTVKILVSIGFKEVLRIEKSRQNFFVDSVVCSIDSLCFGNFVELEGEKKAIDDFITRLGLKKYPVVTQGYVTFQLEWNKNHPVK